MSFANRIRARRLALCLTQRQVAAAAGLHTNTYARMERGEVSPKLATLDRLAAALRTTPSRLVD